MGGIAVNRSFLRLLLLLALASCDRPTPREVTDVWARDTIGSTANAAVFMTITSPAPDRLVAASTPVARQTDLMTMTGDSREMEMKYLAHMGIPADKPVSLNPAGWHVWLTDLKQPLKAGQTFPLVLEFEKAGRREVTVSIIAPAAEPPLSGM
jgi:copper(I)-binding protein